MIQSLGLRASKVARAWVWSLVRDLRSHKPFSTARKQIKIKNKRAQNIDRKRQVDNSYHKMFFLPHIEHRSGHSLRCYVCEFSYTCMVLSTFPRCACEWAKKWFSLACLTFFKIPVSRQNCCYFLFAIVSLPL